MKGGLQVDGRPAINDAHLAILNRMQNVARTHSYGRAGNIFVGAQVKG